MPRQFNRKKKLFFNVNTFLPFKDFGVSARCLDNDRLKKQLVEVYTLLKVLRGETDAWKSHPCSLQWAGYEDSLKWFGWYVFMACFARGFKVEPLQYKLPKWGEDPHWLGNENFHFSHRAKLKYKGRVDRVTYSLRSHLGVRSINSWLASKGFNQKNQLQIGEVLELERLAKKWKVEMPENHYSHFDAPDDNSVPYFWVTKHLR